VVNKFVAINWVYSRVGQTWRPEKPTESWRATFNKDLRRRNESCTSA